MNSIASARPLLLEVQAAGKLPTPPGVILRLLELARNSDVSAKELAETISLDPGLAAKILRFVNSPFSGLRVKVSSLTQAVSLMGARSVKMMALSFSAIPRDRHCFCEGFDHGRFALQSLGCGIAARRLSEETSAYPPADAFVAGLLSQIGRSIFASAFPAPYADVLRRASSVPHDLPPLELARFGETYATLGGQVLQSWGLPEELCHAVEVFRGDEEQRGAPLARILHSAECAIAAICPAADNAPSDVAPFLEHADHDFHLSADRCIAVLNDVTRELETSRALFELPQGKVRHPAEIEAEVRERIAELSIAMHLENQTLAQQQADLMRRATTDALTGVGNRAALDARLTLELDRAARCKTPVALLMIDVDRFKAVNDAHGHLAGDHVLQAIARRLDENIRKVDYCARYGGEEFAVIAPSTPLDGVTNLAERLRQCVEATPVVWEQRTISVSISVGVALANEVTDADRAAREVIRTADRFLYEAKCAGRNRVIVGCWREPASKRPPGK